MGAISFIKTVEARNANDGFSMLVEDARYSRGHDSYNGTISTCSMGGCVKTFSTYNKKNETEARKIISDKDNGVKWVAQYIDLGVVYYEETTVKKIKKTRINFCSAYFTPFSFQKNSTVFGSKPV